MMVKSVRFRLTLWYTGVLALILAALAVGGYRFLVYRIDLRRDAQLEELADAFIHAFAHEHQEHPDLGTTDEIAIETIGEFRLLDRHFIVYDAAGKLVAMSDAPEIPADIAVFAGARSPRSPVATFLEEAARRERAYATLASGPHLVRAFGRTAVVSGTRYAVVTVGPNAYQADLLRQVRLAYWIFIPVGLLIAAGGGSWLVRKSFVPVTEMSRLAERISINRLGDRIPVTDGRDELGQLARVFNAMLDRLEQSFAAQRRFMTDASHELRTPVAIVRGEADVALSAPNLSPTQLRESLAVIGDEARRLTRIVDDLFLLARADAGRHPLTASRFDLGETVADAARAMRTPALAHEVALRFDQPEAEMPFVGDEGLIRRLVLNLLDNAVKYTPADGSVQVGLEETDGVYRLTVADTGIGIAAVDQPHIFERFHRGIHPVERPPTGSGLGLAIVKWIAHAHHGDAVLTRSDATGSLFTVTLPRSSFSSIEERRRPAETHP